MFDVIRDVLAVLGGAGIIIFGLSRFLGGVWRDRLKEKGRKDSDIEIDTHRQRLANKRIQADQFVKSQYDVYIKLWQSLQGLKLAVEILWERVDNQNIVALANSLRTTRQMVDSWSIFFEEDNLNEIDRMLKVLERFHAGKKRLLRIRDVSDVASFFVEDIEHQIAQNREYKEQFEELLNQTRGSFKRRLSNVGTEPEFA